MMHGGKGVGGQGAGWVQYGSAISNLSTTPTLNLSGKGLQSGDTGVFVFVADNKCTTNPTGLDGVTGETNRADRNGGAAYDIRWVIWTAPVDGTTSDVTVTGLTNTDTTASLTCTVIRGVTYGGNSTITSGDGTVITPPTMSNSAGDFGMTFIFWESDVGASVIASPFPDDRENLDYVNGYDGSTTQGGGTNIGTNVLLAANYAPDDWLVDASTDFDTVSMWFTPS
jgi:hypothetical protein